MWATGIPLNDPNCLEDTKWIGQGILGQMLESIHNDQVNYHRGVIGIRYHQQPANIINTPQVPLAGPDMLQQLSASPIDFPQAIPGGIPNSDPPREEPLSGPESASASTSTSLVSDTTATATDTDPHEVPPDEPTHESDTIHSIIETD